MIGEPDNARVRTGIGYDCHRFSPRRRLVLGGVELDHPRGLEGHSDADVVTHAVIDALLGAAGLEDIGHHFPDSDERYRDADSIGLLRETGAMLAEHGLKVDNVDATIVIERPAISPVRGAMRQRLAEALGVSVGQVNVKATRGEGMGFVGREEGVAHWRSRRSRSYEGGLAATGSVARRLMSFCVSRPARATAGIRRRA